MKKVTNSEKALNENALSGALITIDKVNEQLYMCDILLPLAKDNFCSIAIDSFIVISFAVRSKRLFESLGNFVAKYNKFYNVYIFC